MKFYNIKKSIVFNFSKLKKVYWIGIGADKIKPLPKNSIEEDNEYNFGYDD